MTLEEIIKKEQERRYEDGSFGIKACKEEIIWNKENMGRSYYTQLEEYVKRSNSSPLFNKMMVLACWELINEK